MDIFLRTYEEGICVNREWLVRGAKWDQYPEWIFIKVGSDSHRDVVIPHPSVEGWHLEFEIDRETHKMWIINMTETDKVIVSGDKMEPLSNRRIFFGEHFQIGNLRSTMALEATPWPNAIMPPETDAESDKESRDGRKTSSPPESEKSSSEEEESCGQSTQSTILATIGELAQRLLEKIDQMKEANNSRRLIFSDWDTTRLPTSEIITSDKSDETVSELPVERNAHFENTKSSNGAKVFITKKGILRTPSLSIPAEPPSTNQRSKKGILGSASKYFPSENQPSKAEFKVTAGPLSVETHEGLLATPSPTARIVPDKPGKEVMSEKMESFHPPRRTGIAKVYRQFYSSKTPMMSVPRVTQADSDREMNKSLLPLPEQTTSDSWTEQKIYEEIESLCQSSEKKMDVEPNESSTGESCEPTLDILTSKKQPKEGGVDRTLILTHRSRARKELQSKATQELMSPHLKTPIALNKKNSNKPGLGQRMKPLTIPELLEEEVLATTDGILPESESDEVSKSENHQVEATVYPDNQNGEQNEDKVDRDTLGVQSEIQETRGHYVATPNSSHGKTYPKEGGHHKFKETTLGHYIEKLYPERWRAYTFPDSPNCSHELRDPYSTLRTHVHSPRGTSATGAQWVMNKVKGSTTQDTVMRTTHMDKELQGQQRLFIGQLPRDFGPGQLQVERFGKRSRTNRDYSNVYTRGPRRCFLHMRNSLEVLPRDYGPTEKCKRPGNGIARAWGQAHFKEGGLLRAPIPARSVRTKPRAKVGPFGLVRAGSVFARADEQAREVKKSLGVSAEGGAGGKSNNGQVQELQG
ncbi:hypothetical protein EJ110_NYTH27592 [Nymphaea thermarum]|nr:hypothetical protein EJ110_NYTH27592 [Nymphaea thermarum]